MGTGRPIFNSNGHVVAVVQELMFMSVLCSSCLFYLSSVKNMFFSTFVFSCVLLSYLMGSFTTLTSVFICLWDDFFSLYFYFLSLFHSLSCVCGMRRLMGCFLLLLFLWLFLHFSCLFFVLFFLNLDLVVLQHLLYFLFSILIIFFYPFYCFFTRFEN